jgi:hypothetical protein
MSWELIEETHWHSAAVARHYLDFTRDLLLGVDSV